MDLAARFARDLEAGRFGTSRVGRVAAGAYAHLAAGRVARPLSFPDTARVLAVGGATLGGSGRTPVALACARALLAQGAPVCLIGHGYRASPGLPRIVAEDDPLSLVGDEALLAARALARYPGARVVVAPRRQDALTLALRHAERAVLDGVLQTRPRRAALALLALDALTPWGSGACPPAGDLRAPAAALLDACDAVVKVGGAGAPVPGFAGEGAPFRPPFRGVPVSRGATFEGRPLAWCALRGLRVGLLTSLARPSRLVSTLAREGVFPLATISAADHATPSLRALARVVALQAAQRLDLWLASPKCALHLEAGGPSRFTLPVAVLDYEVTVEPRLVDEVCRAMCVEPPPASPLEV